MTGDGWGQLGTAGDARGRLGTAGDDINFLTSHAIFMYRFNFPVTMSFPPTLLPLTEPQSVVEML